MSERASSALELEGAPRFWLGALGVIATVAVALIVLLRDGALPDLLLAALAISAVVSFALCVIGRLPSGFEVAGMPVSFTVDTLSDLLGTIRGLEDVDPEARNTVVELIEKAAAPEILAAANTRYGNADAEATVPSSDEADGLGHSRDTVKDRVRVALEAVADGPVLERQDVENSGKGKNPKFDYQFSVIADGERRVVICQIERYWNPSSVDLLKRRINRALLDSTVVSHAVIVVPEAGFDTVRAALRNTTGVSVLTEEQFDDPDAARTRLQKEFRRSRR